MWSSSTMESSQQQQRNHHNQSQPDLHQQHHTPTRPPLHTSLTHIPLLPLRSASSTPMSSHGLFNPSASRQSGGQASSLFDNNTPTSDPNTVHLHPLQSHQVRETHKALIDNNNASGRKSINQYEVIEEIGRGMSGKVKLARNTDTGDNVAIKIIPRFSKKRRLGKVTALSPQDKTKKEIAILKKIRHPNVVALLEVIDDPELKKIYMVLEHVELGEIVWRKKGLPHICNYERKRTEREMRGEAPTSEEEQYDQMLERRQALREFKRRRMVQNCVEASEPWSVEHGAADDATNSSGPASRVASKEDFTTGGASPSASAIASTAITTAATATTRTTTAAATAAIAMAAQSICRRPSITPSQPYSCSSSPGRFSAQDDLNEWNEDSATPGPFQQQPMSAGPFDNSMLAAFLGEDFCFRGRAPSNADSVISHMSSVAENMRAHDPFADDFSYVPCFTFDQARSAFRDTVLGLEFLHYQGVVHRDIKPANLLWSKDHRVKISDFGVSYFGRPIRDGEPDELISESEAKDFDDDLELSKTVGTPAFFAPELCHTDLDKEQPKVSEQIDVWSLGVTLYCLIFARIPFLAEDEFQMFRKIAREDVYIPRRRLKPVDPSTSPTATSLFKRQNSHPYRDDNVLEHEEVDDQLLDLLVQMLTKNPEQRIRLRDIKRHPWVLQGLSNPVSWLEDTDPARRTSGHKIQVDEKEMSSAVVPLTFLERARSVVKKAVGKVMQPLMDREGSRSRRRAASSAASSVGDSMFKNAPAMPQSHNDRLRSLHPNDDFFGDATQDNTPGEGASPFSTLVSGGSGTQPAGAAYDPMATVLPLRPGNLRMGTHSRSGSETVREEDGRPVFFSASRASHRPGQQHGSQQFLRLTPIVSGPHPSSDEWALHDEHEDGYRREADATAARRQGASSPLSQFMDRCLFSSPDKRGSPRVSLDTSAAHGSTHASRHVRAMHSVDFGGRRKDSYSLSSSPLSASPHSLSSSYQHRQPQSDPNFTGQLQGRADGRPVTAHRVDLGDGTDKEASGSSVPGRRPRMQTAAESATIPCPLPLSQPTRPSWCGEHAEPISRGETMASVKTASSGSIDRLGTPLTTPSEAASLMAAFPPSKDIAHHIAAYQSDPSLPALLSGASSVSADLEGELLGRPGIIGAQASLLETTDSLTPPALAKEPGTSEVAMRLESREGRRVDEEEEEENSDDGVLLMVTARKRPPTVSKGPPFAVRRRDTNFSTASDETARRVVVDDVVDEDGES